MGICVIDNLFPIIKSLMGLHKKRKPCLFAIFTILFTTLYLSPQLANAGHYQHTPQQLQHIPGTRTKDNSKTIACEPCKKLQEKIKEAIVEQKKQEQLPQCNSCQTLQQQVREAVIVQQPVACDTGQQQQEQVHKVVIAKELIECDKCKTLQEQVLRAVEEAKHEPISLCDTCQQLQQQVHEAVIAQELIECDTCKSLQHQIKKALEEEKHEPIPLCDTCQQLQQQVREAVIVPQPVACDTCKTLQEQVHKVVIAKELIECDTCKSLQEQVHRAVEENKKTTENTTMLMPSATPSMIPSDSYNSSPLPTPSPSCMPTPDIMPTKPIESCKTKNCKNLQEQIHSSVTQPSQITPYLPTPSPQPSYDPTPNPTIQPSASPSENPSYTPTVQPGQSGSSNTADVSQESIVSTSTLAHTPSPQPSYDPTPKPTIQPSASPSENPSYTPTITNSLAATSSSAPTNVLPSDHSSDQVDDQRITPIPSTIAPQYEKVDQTDATQMTHPDVDTIQDNNIKIAQDKPVPGKFKAKRLRRFERKLKATGNWPVRKDTTSQTDTPTDTSTDPLVEPSSSSPIDQTQQTGVDLTSDSSTPDDKQDTTPTHTPASAPTTLATSSTTIINPIAQNNISPQHSPPPSIATPPPHIPANYVTPPSVAQPQYVPQPAPTPQPTQQPNTWKKVENSTKKVVKTGEGIAKVESSVSKIYNHFKGDTPKPNASADVNAAPAYIPHAYGYQSIASNSSIAPPTASQMHTPSFSKQAATLYAPPPANPQNHYTAPTYQPSPLQNHAIVNQSYSPTYQPTTPPHDYTTSNPSVDSAPPEPSSQLLDLNNTDTNDAQRLQQADSSTLSAQEKLNQANAAFNPHQHNQDLVIINPLAQLFTGNQPAVPAQYNPSQSDAQNGNVYQSASMPAQQYGQQYEPSQNVHQSSNFTSGTAGTQSQGPHQGVYQDNVTPNDPTSASQYASQGAYHSFNDSSQNAAIKPFQSIPTPVDTNQNDNQVTPYQNSNLSDSSFSSGASPSTDILHQQSFSPPNDQLIQQNDTPPIVNNDAQHPLPSDMQNPLSTNNYSTSPDDTMIPAQHNNDSQHSFNPPNTLPSQQDLPQNTQSIFTPPDNSSSVISIPHPSNDQVHLNPNIPNNNQVIPTDTIAPSDATSPPVILNQDPLKDSQGTNSAVAAVMLNQSPHNVQQGTTDPIAPTMPQGTHTPNQMFTQNSPTPQVPSQLLSSPTQDNPSILTPSDSPSSVISPTPDIPHNNQVLLNDNPQNNNQVIPTDTTTPPDVTSSQVITQNNSDPQIVANDASLSSAAPTALASNPSQLLQPTDSHSIPATPSKSTFFTNAQSNPTNPTQQLNTNDTLQQQGPLSDITTYQLNAQPVAPLLLSDPQHSLNGASSHTSPQAQVLAPIHTENTANNTQNQTVAPQVTANNDINLHANNSYDAINAAQERRLRPRGKKDIADQVGGWAMFMEALQRLALSIGL